MQEKNLHNAIMLSILGMRKLFSHLLIQATLICSCLANITITILNSFHFFASLGCCRIAVTQLRVNNI